MKEIWLLMLLLLCGHVSAASDVEITVTGKVVAMPCDVEQKTMTVNLGELYPSEINNDKGKEASWSEFSITLINCPEGTSKVTATITGKEDGAYFANAGDAKGVQIQLQSGGANIHNGKSQQFNVNNKRALLKFKARPVSSEKNATSGSIQSAINISYTYQ